MFSPTQPDSQPEKPKNDNSNLDDIFSSPSSSAGTPPPYSPPPQNTGGVDDLFSSPPPNTGGPYTPPPQPPQQRGNNRVLYIILGIVLAFMCVCVACIAVAGGSVVAVFQDPTFKAGFATGQAGFATAGSNLGTLQGVLGTAGASGVIPTQLPPDAVSKGALNVGQSQTSTLGAVARDAWKYDGKGGDRIVINAKPQDPDLILNLAIYDPSGQLVDKTVLFTSDQPGLTVRLPNDGTYTIVISALGGTANNSGSYTVSVQASR
jgi:hypothetical protein